MVIGAPESATVITNLLEVRQVIVWIAWACLSASILYLCDLSWYSMAFQFPLSSHLPISTIANVEYLQKSAWMLDRWHQVIPNRSVKWLLMWKSRQFVEDWNTSLRPSRRSECVACNMSNLDAGFHSLLVFEVVIFSYLNASWLVVETVEGHKWSRCFHGSVSLLRGMFILYLMLASMLFIDVFMGHVLFTSVVAWSNPVT